MNRLHIEGNGEHVLKSVLPPSSCFLWLWASQQQLLARAEPWFPLWLLTAQVWSPLNSLADFCARRAQMEVGPSMCRRFGLAKVSIPCLRVTSAFTLAQPGRVEHLPGGATLQSSSGRGAQPYLPWD